MAEEQCHDQCSNVCTVHVGIGHNNYFMIAQLTKVECLRIFLGTKGNTQCGEDISHLLALKHLMLHRFLHIQDLTTQWQDCLNLTVATSLSSTTRRISLHKEQLALGWVFTLAVCQLTRQTATTERRFAQYALASITRSNTRLSSQDHFLYDLLRIFWVLLQVVGQCLAHSRRHYTCYL